MFFVQYDQGVDRASSSSKAVPRAHRKGIPLRTESPRYTEDRGAWPQTKRKMPLRGPIKQRKAP